MRHNSFISKLLHFPSPLISYLFQSVTPPQKKSFIFTQPSFRHKNCPHVCRLFSCHSRSHYSLAAILLHTFSNLGVDVLLTPYILLCLQSSNKCHLATNSPSELMPDLILIPPIFNPSVTAHLITLWGPNTCHRTTLKYFTATLLTHVLTAPLLKMRSLDSK